MSNSPFDFIKSITQSKKSLYEDPEIFNKEYASFIVNRGLANDASLCLFANEMNKYPSLDKKLQYDFLLTAIHKTNSFVKWIKKEAEEADILDVINIIMQTYQTSTEKSYEIYKLLTEDKIEYLLNMHGGTRKTKNGTSIATSGRGKGKPKKP